jgi:hypothetical protein
MAEQLTDASAMAERELAAFLKAVGEQYGSAQAQLSAAEWLEEFESFDGPLPLNGDCWRPITIAAAIQLASRLHPEPTYTKVSPIPSSNCSHPKRLA